MKWILILGLIMGILFLTACQERIVEKEYVCPNGDVVSDTSLCKGQDIDFGNVRTFEGDSCAVDSDCLTGSDIPISCTIIGSARCVKGECKITNERTVKCTTDPCCPQNYICDKNLGKYICIKNKGITG